MKKLLKKIVIAATSIMLAFGFVACQGQPGKSAYEIAVQNGFKGTEQEYLASLKGADGKDAEKLTIQEIYEASGYQGTLQQFIDEYLNLDVPVNNNTDTIAKNIASIMSVFPNM